MSREKFEKGRNFANKIWNASRFILLNIREENTSHDLCVVFQKEKLGLPERWILSNFYEMLTQLEKALEGYRFNEAVNLIYDFFWRKFCDWYLEIAKLNINDKNTQLVLFKVLEKSLRVLHPFMPFITEEVWQKLPGVTESISISATPHIQKEMIDKKTDHQMQIIMDIVAAARNIRSNVKIPPNEFISLQIQAANKAKSELITQNENIIKALAQAKEITFHKKATKISPLMSSKVASAKPKAKAFWRSREKGVSAVISKDLSINIPLEGLVDAQKEKQRISSQIKELETLLKDKEKRLKNKVFLSKAPEEVVELEKERVAELKERLIKLKEILRAFAA